MPGEWARHQTRAAVSEAAIAGDFWIPQAVIQHATHWLDASPETLEAFEYRGMTFEALRSFDAATADYERAIELGSRSPDVWRGLAYLYSATGRDKDFQSLATKILRQFPSRRPAACAWLVETLLVASDSGIDQKTVTELAEQSQLPILVGVARYRAGEFADAKAALKPHTRSALAMILAARAALALNDRPAAEKFFTAAEQLLSQSSFRQAYRRWLDRELATLRDHLSTAKPE